MFFSQCFGQSLCLLNLYQMACQRRRKEGSRLLWVRYSSRSAVFNVETPTGAASYTVYADKIFQPSIHVNATTIHVNAKYDNPPPPPPFVICSLPECCTGNVALSGVLCSDSLAAPCIMGKWMVLLADGGILFQHGYRPGPRSAPHAFYLYTIPTISKLYACSSSPRNVVA